MKLNFFNRHLGFLTSGFVSGSVTDSAIEKVDPENMGLAVGILFLASLEAEMHLGGSLPPPLQHKRH